MTVHTATPWYFRPDGIQVEANSAEGYGLTIGNCGQSDMLERCECGRGDMVTLPNGERHCSDTLRKFEMQNGRPYGVR